MIALSRLKAKFKTDALFNDEVLDILANHKNMLQLDLVIDEQVIASVPMYLEGKEFKFPSSLFPFVDYRWFTNEASTLSILEGVLYSKGYSVDIVGLTGGMREDVGIGLMNCLREDEFVQSYDTKMNSKLRQAQRYSKNLSYTLSRVRVVEVFIRDWFNRFDNPDIDLVLELYEYWESMGILDAMLVSEYCYCTPSAIACDILIRYDGMLYGMLTPWNKDSEHLRKLWIGWFVLIKACDYGAKIGIKKFSIGDTIMDYKKKFVVETMPTYFIGCGRREFRDA